MSEIKLVKDFTRLFQSAEETEKGEQGIVEGNIPSWLNGTFIRNGSAKFDIGEKFTFNHFLDGFSMLSKFDIENGQKITFHKKYLKSDAYEKAMAAKRSILPEFGTKGSADPTKNIFSRFVSTILPLELSDNCAGSVAQVGHDLICTNDACFIRRIDSDLKTYEKYDVHDYFNLTGACAHYLKDQDGTYYNIASTVKSGLKFQILKLPYEKNDFKEMIENSKILASIPSRWGTAIAFNHSFGLTDRFIILIEQPYVTSMTKVASMILKGGGAIKSLLEWRGDRDSNRFILIEKKSGKVLEPFYFSKDPFFFLHFINSYDQDNEVIIDLITYKTPALLDKMFIKDLRKNIVDPGDPPIAQRFRLPLVEMDQIKDNVNLISSTHQAKAFKTNNLITVEPENLTGFGIDGPTINKNYLGSKYNYFYGTGLVQQKSQANNQFENSISKVNLQTREIISWRESSLAFPGEPIFIQKPCDSHLNVDEDDGIIMSAVTDLKDKKDFLVFLDAKTMKEVGRVKFNSHVPTAFHGIFLPKISS